MMRADLPGDEQARRSRRAEEAVKGIDVLLVEDDPGDVLMTKEAFEERHIADRLHVVGDGVLALQFLRRTDEFTGAPRPGLILLDLNLPRVNGLQVLAEIKSDAELRQIPVVILTTSSAEEEVTHTYDLQASAFVQKPMDVRKFIRAVQVIDEFYGHVARLPRHLTGSWGRGTRGAPGGLGRRRAGHPPAAGNRTVTVVPSPGIERSSIRPPQRDTIACATARPRPLPCPGGLVVKKGSNTLPMTSPPMPCPVSRT